VDNCNSFTVQFDQFNKLTLREKVKALVELQTELDLTQGTGYLNTLNLLNFNYFVELLPYFFTESEGDNVLPYFNGELSMETYKWLYNLTILNLYYLCLASLESINLVDIGLDDLDILTDLKRQESVLLGKLDPSIRYYIRKNGINIIKHAYIGFDTEYTKKNPLENTLVSAQLAIASRIYIKIPKPTLYEISSFDVERNRVEKQSKGSGVFNLVKIETSIQLLLQKIKLIKFGNYDESMVIIGECFKQIQGVKFSEGDENVTFSLPRSAIQPYIILKNKTEELCVSLDNIVKIASAYTHKSFETGVDDLVNLLRDIGSKRFTLSWGRDKLLEDVYKHYHDYSAYAHLVLDSDRVLPYTIHEKLPRIKTERKLSRVFVDDLFQTGQKVCITSTQKYYLISHLTQADLCMLSDFDLIKGELNIVNGSFVTLHKPLKICDKYVHVRDTMLLAPAGSKTLAQIGSLYGSDFNKLVVAPKDIERMDEFLESNRSDFVDYALRDALISLIHSFWMEDFCFAIGSIGVPLSLSTIGRKYVKSIWKEDKYRGYQVSSKYTMGDVSVTMTPKGLNGIKDVGFVLPYYIANYKGGRNESFMYGIDNDTTWYDYDLTSAYTTVMSMAGHPEYSALKRLTHTELGKLSRFEILYSYLIIHADFEFLPETKYPSIACFVDESCTIFPTQGSCVITGSEYLLALKQGCKFVFKTINFIPFKESSESSAIDKVFVKPFENIIKLVQEKRREYPKGSISNLMYKEIGNSIYGSVVRGISNKMKLDTKTNTMQRMRGDDLSNPLIAS
jgi:hypothetical protein